MSTASVEQKQTSRARVEGKGMPHIMPRLKASSRARDFLCTFITLFIAIRLAKPRSATMAGATKAKEGPARKQRVLKGLEPKHLWCAVPLGRVWFVSHLCVKPLVWRRCWWMAGRSVGRSVWGSVHFV